MDDIVCEGKTSSEQSNLIAQPMRKDDINLLHRPTMFKLFTKNPIAKLDKSYKAKLEQAMTAQRNGDIKRYSQLSDEAENIRKEIDTLEILQKK